MDPSTASYYRAILFVDGLDSRPLPKTLLQLHGWAVKRHLALGLGGVISKAVALTVAMTWMSSTREGQEFTRDCTPLGDIFSGQDTMEGGGTGTNWDALEAESAVIVTLKDDTKKTGQFIARRGNWLDVRVEGEVKHFQTSKVQLVGA